MEAKAKKRTNSQREEKERGRGNGKEDEEKKKNTSINAETNIRNGRHYTAIYQQWDPKKRMNVRGPCKIPRLSYGLAIIGKALLVPTSSFPFI